MAPSLSVIRTQLPFGYGLLTRHFFFFFFFNPTTLLATLPEGAITHSFVQRIYSSRASNIKKKY